MLSPSETKLETLRKAGYRLTAARKAAVGILAATKTPLTATDVLKAFAKKRVQADRATVYRELEFLVHAGVAAPVRFEDRAVRYELAGLAHHHHAVCLKCETVQDVEVDAELEAVEKRIAKRVGFDVLRHAFELFGLCKKCR